MPNSVVPPTHRTPSTPHSSSVPAHDPHSSWSRGQINESDESEDEPEQGNALTTDAPAPKGRFASFFNRMPFTDKVRVGPWGHC